MTTAVDPKAVHVPHPRPNAAVVVYGIAHAGAGAAPWAPVGQALPASVELRAIRLPGRENRFRQPAHTTMTSAATEVAQVIDEDVRGHDKPAFVMGSCFGALVAVAAAGLSVAGFSGLIAVRQPVPDNVDTGDDPGSMDGPRLSQWLREHRITPEALLTGSMFEFYEPVVRADLRTGHQYRYAGPVLNTPVHIVHCPWNVAEPDVDQWRRVTAANVRTTCLDVLGDPITDHPAELTSVITQVVADALPWFRRNLEGNHR